MASSSTIMTHQWLTCGKHHHATHASVPSGMFFFFSFLFFLLISSFVVQSPQSHAVWQHPLWPRNNPDHNTIWCDDTHHNHTTTLTATQHSTTPTMTTQQPQLRHNTVWWHPLWLYNNPDHDATQHDDTHHGHTTNTTAIWHPPWPHNNSACNTKYGMMTAPTTQNAAQWQHLQHKTQHDDNAHNTKCSTACFELVETVCTYRLA